MGASKITSYRHRKTAPFPPTGDYGKPYVTEGRDTKILGWESWTGDVESLEDSRNGVRLAGPG